MSSDEDYKLGTENIGIGSNGHAHYGYGIGQSLLMLPADVVGTVVARLVLGAQATSGDGELRIRRVVVSYLAFPLLGVLTAYSLSGFFIALGLDRSIALCAVLLSFIATRWFNASQDFQEVGVRVFCLLTGAWLLLRWREVGREKYLWGAGVFFGFLILITIVSMIDIAVICCAFVALLIMDRGRAVWRSAWVFSSRIFICCAVALIADRAYHFIRFGELTSTYASLYFARLADLRQQYPGMLRDEFANAAFPWITPIHEGVIGALVSPKWGVVWFDPSAVLMISLFIMYYRVWDRAVKLLSWSAIALLLIIICFYARYFQPAGWVSWGDRYAAVPATLLSMLGVFMMFRTWNIQRLSVRASSLFICGSAIVIQLSSGFFNSNLEITQLANGCGSRWIVVQRLQNIFEYFRGRFAGQDCVAQGMQWAWDPNVFPGVLARTALKSTNQIYLVWSVWGGLLCLILLLVAWLLIIMRRSLPRKNTKVHEHSAAG